ncbi:MAG: hypothetical protein QOH11_106 [Solirubrobacteraceae bacterium]|nr:hypothetical protein [Solirubrobacteraceae bacterium]
MIRPARDLQDDRVGTEPADALLDHDAVAHREQRRAAGRGVVDALVDVAAGQVLARQRKRHAVVEHEPALGGAGMEHDSPGTAARGTVGGGAAVRRPRPGGRGQRRELALRLRGGGGADRGCRSAARREHRLGADALDGLRRGEPGLRGAVARGLRGRERARDTAAVGGRGRRVRGIIGDDHVAREEGRPGLRVDPAVGREMARALEGDEYRLRLFAEAAVDVEMRVRHDAVELLLQRRDAVARVAEVQEDRIRRRRLAGGAALVARGGPGERRCRGPDHHRRGHRQRGALAPRGAAAGVLGEASPLARARERAVPQMLRGEVAVGQDRPEGLCVTCGHGGPPVLSRAYGVS